MRMELLLAIAVLLAASCIGERVVPRERPTEVPSDASWAGGADGGSWIRCEVREARQANYCTVYHENSGDIIAEGWFVLRDTGRAAPLADLTYSAFDGYEIHLEGGDVLTPVELKTGLMPGQ